AQRVDRDRSGVRTGHALHGADSPKALSTEVLACAVSGHGPAALFRRPGFARPEAAPIWGARAALLGQKEISDRSRYLRAEGFLLEVVIIYEWFSAHTIDGADDAFRLCGSSESPAFSWDET